MTHRNESSGGHQDSQGMERMTWVEVELLSLKNGRLRGGLTAVHSTYGEIPCRQTQTLLGGAQGKDEDDGHKQKQEKF